MGQACVAEAALETEVDKGARAAAAEQEARARPAGLEAWVEPPGRRA